MVSKRQSLFQAVGIGLVVLLAGCLAVPSGSVSDADSVGEQVQLRYDAIDRYEATVTKTVDAGDRTSSVHATVTVDKSEFTRIAYHSGPHAGTVRKTSASSTATVDPILSTSLGPSSERQLPSYGALAAELVRTNNVTVEQTAVLGERRTVVVSVVPDSTETDDRVERRLWIDSERLIPLRIETTWTRSDGQTVTETVRYSNVTLGEQGAEPSTTESRGVGA